MACYHPLKAWQIGLTSAGKPDYKITGYEVDHIDVVGDKFWPSSVPDRSSIARRTIRDYIEVPCGNCIGCRLAYSRMWADRCMLEMTDHDSAYFVTFTYGEDTVPRVYYADPDTGEAMQALSLRKRDIQLFFKRLRKQIGYKIRYFCAGEYGDKTLRPHYHAIIFGLRLDDLKYYMRSKTGDDYYLSESLTRIWQNGHVVVGCVSWETCAYTARYVLKKLKGAAADFYTLHNIEPPFLVMSRKPGIARNYYDAHPDLFGQSCIFLSTDTGSKPVYPSRYYKKLLEIDNPEMYNIVKERSADIASASMQAKLARTDLDYIKYLAVEEAAQEQLLRGLSRLL